MINFIRSLPHFKGKFRLLRFIIKKQIRAYKDIIVYGKNNVVYKLPNLKENLAFEIYADGIYERETIETIIKYLPQDGIFLDIGANIGSICIPVSKLRPDVTAICVEASPKVFEYLEYNVKLNKLNNCVLINKLISDKDDELCDFFSPTELFGKGSSNPSFTNESEIIKSITIDTLLKKVSNSIVNFIKIDIEGFECFAFNGAEKTLTNKNAPSILFEFLDSAEKEVHGIKVGDAQKILVKHNYNIFKIKKNKSLEKLNAILLKGETQMLATKFSDERK